MGHATHTDTLEDFKTAHCSVHNLVHNLVHVSMDGPNVNLRVLEDYKKVEDLSAPSLIYIGSCRVHVIHGAYGTAPKMTDWEFDKPLKAAHGISHKSPSSNMLDLGV